MTNSLQFNTTHIEIIPHTKGESEQFYFWPNDFSIASRLNKVIFVSYFLLHKANFLAILLNLSLVFEYFYTYF